MRSFLASLASLALISASCGAQQVWFGGPFVLGTVPVKELPEASGIVASTTNPDVVWLHNDSGDEPRLYALSTKGALLTTVKLGNAKARDWEDIAYGPGPDKGTMYLYVADIGDNDAKRKDITVYRVAEPSVGGKTSKQSLALNNIVADVFTFRYPDGARDAEALLVDPRTQDIFIVTKRDKQARLYRAAAPHTTGTTRTLEFVSTLPMTLITGGDIDHDGSAIILKDYLHVWHWKRGASESVAAALKRPGTRVTYMPEAQGEAICFTAKDDGYYTVSEREDGGSSAPLIFYPQVRSEKEAASTRDAKIPLISVEPSKDTPGIYDLRYVIPEVSRVDVTVVNALMMKVIDVASESGEAGVQEREIDLIDQPTGSYAVVIRLNTGAVVTATIDHKKP